MSPVNTDYQYMKFTTGKRAKSSHLIKWLPFMTITLFPPAVLAQQFTPQQMLDVMTKSPSNRDVRVQDAAVAIPMYRQNGVLLEWRCSNDGLTTTQLPSTCSY